jgi:hypothetical protein
MKTEITFYIKNLQLNNPFKIGNFSLIKVTDYDNLITEMKKKERDTVTYNAITIIDGENPKAIQNEINNKLKELNQITWLFSFVCGIRISAAGWNIAPKIDGVPTGSFWPTKSAGFPHQRIIHDFEIEKFFKQIESKISDNGYLENNKLLFPIAFYLSGLEDKMLTNCFILPFISFESLVFHNTEEYIFGIDKLPHGLNSQIQKVLENHSSYLKLPKERREELLKKIFELKRRPIMSRVNDFLKNNNIFLKDYEYDIKTIFEVRNIIFHTAAKIEERTLMKCMKDIRSLVVRSILAKMEYNGKYNEIVKGWAETEFP